MIKATVVSKTRMETTSRSKVTSRGTRGTPEVETTRTPRREAGTRETSATIVMAAETVAEMPVEMAEVVVEMTDEMAAEMVETAVMEAETAVTEAAMVE